jgi:hypothetical protein
LIHRATQIGDIIAELNPKELMVDSRRNYLKKNFDVKFNALRVFPPIELQTYPDPLIDGENFYDRIECQHLHTRYIPQPSTTVKNSRATQIIKNIKSWHM